MRSNLAEALCELGRCAEAAEFVEQALADLRELGDHSGEGNALLLLSWARRGLGDLEAAGRAIAAALSIADDEDNQMWRGHWLVESAKVERARGNPTEALRLCQESAGLQRRLGDTAREAAAMDGAGEACQSLGRFEEAAKLHRHAVAAYRGLDARWQLAGSLANLSDALNTLGEREPARAARQEALHLLTPLDDPQAVALARQLGDHG
jgi:tetratricopeptide (TPR) repeat protein